MLAVLEGVGGVSGKSCCDDDLVSAFVGGRPIVVLSNH